MNQIKTILYLIVLFIIISAIFNISINAQRINMSNNDECAKGYSSDEVIFFEDFDDYPTQLRIMNWFTDFTIHNRNKIVT